MTDHSLSLLFSFVALIVCVSAQTPDLVIEVFRHGARGPISQAFDPNQTYWGNNVAQLTPMGMRMHYILGTAIRERYSELLTSYSPDTIYVRSTDVDRTIMSAYSHMYGVFGHTGPNFTSTNNASAAIPPYVSPDVNELVANLSSISAALPNNYQPVPVHVVQASNDVILASSGACPMFANWYTANTVGPKTLSVFQNEMDDIVKYLRGQGLIINNFLDLSLAGDNAITNRVQGIPLPGNVNPITQEQYYKDLKFAAEWYTTQMVEGTPNQVKLFAINLLDFISGSINATHNGTSSRNFMFLSAHDTTLLGLLSAFEIVTTDCLQANYNNDKKNLPIENQNCIYPQFASNVIFEFYNTDEPYVLFYYNGMQVPICGNSSNNCTLKQFQSYIIQVTGGLTPQDYLEICKSPETMVMSDEQMIYTYKIIIIILAIVAFIVLIALSLVIFRMYKKNKELQKEWFSLNSKINQESSQRL